MSRRRRHQPDSLELLLDTMCNTFGGIIMIALLIALLSRDTDANATATQSFRKQLEQVERQTAEAEQLQKKLTETTDTNVITAIALLKERDELQRKLEEEKRAIETNAILQTRIAAMFEPNEAKGLQEKKQTREMEARLLTEELQTEARSHQRQLRFPRERATGKRTFYFIVRFGQIFPVHLMRNGNRELNRESLEWEAGPQGESATPLRNAGIDLATFARSLNDIPGQTFSIHFLAYNDSFPMFLAARQVPLTRGFDTGWEFLSGDKPVVFSSRGAAPPAL